MTKLDSDSNGLRCENMTTLGNIGAIVNAGKQTNLVNNENCQLNGNVTNRTDEG